MRIRFWGTRGSIPSPLTNAALISKVEAAVKMALETQLKSQTQIPAFLQQLPWFIQQTAGGDTACVEIRTPNVLIVLDAGTGIRHLGLDLLARSDSQPQEVHIFLTHTHWDHISGIPFFSPAMVPGNKINIYSPYPDMAQRLKRQQSPEYFPTPLAAAFNFIQIDEHHPISIDDVCVNILPLNHPGSSYGYRIVHDTKSVIYATDAEYQELTPESLKPYTGFFKGAELLIFDAQYTMLENVEKENWGHSNVFIGIDMAVEAGVKRLAFTHHDPNYNDEKLWSILVKAKEYLRINQPGSNLELLLAHEGLIVTV